MRILTVTSLFPNAASPRHGIFIETRMREYLQRYPESEVTVIAPIPWFPFSHRVFGAYADYARAPAEEHRSGMRVYHPRYPVVPKLGMNITPRFLAASIDRCLSRLERAGQSFDLIDAHYYYPDGCAVAAVAAKRKLPFTITARGSDITLLPRYRHPRKCIQQALSASSMNLAVCEALKQEMVALGAGPESVVALRNGVDTGLFAFAADGEQASLRRGLGLPVDRSVIISVGNLVPLKGHELIIRAVAQIPQAQLVILGAGPEEDRLRSLVSRLQLGDRVRILAPVDQPRLARYYAAADCSVLASSSEGWANVLLESMACGTPVVATAVWGTPEIVSGPAAGVLVEREVAAIRQGIEQLLSDGPPRSDTRRHAEHFSWQATCDGLHKVYREIVMRQRQVAPGVSNMKLESPGR